MNPGFPEITETPNSMNNRNPGIWFRRLALLLAIMVSATGVLSAEFRLGAAAVSICGVSQSGREAGVIARNRACAKPGTCEA